MMQVVMELKLANDRNKVVIFVHPRGRMYFPSMNRLYGSDFNKFSMLDNRKYGAKQYFQMNRVDWTLLNEPGAPCDEQDK